MGNKKEVKYVQWKSIPLKQFFKKLPKPTLRMRLFRFGKWIKDKIFPPNKPIIHGYKGYVETTHVPHHEKDNFKKGYIVDPQPRRTFEDMVREDMLWEGYKSHFKSEERDCDCNCDHEH